MSSARSERGDRDKEGRRSLGSRRGETQTSSRSSGHVSSARSEPGGKAYSSREKKSRSSGEEGGERDRDRDRDRERRSEGGLREGSQTERGHRSLKSSSSKLRASSNFSANVLTSIRETNSDPRDDCSSVRSQDVASVASIDSGHHSEIESENESGGEAGEKKPIYQLGMLAQRVEATAQQLVRGHGSTTSECRQLLAYFGQAPQDASPQLLAKQVQALILAIHQFWTMLATAFAEVEKQRQNCIQRGNADFVKQHVGLELFNAAAGQKDAKDKSQARKWTVKQQLQAKRQAKTMLAEALKKSLELAYAKGTVMMVVRNVLVRQGYEVIKPADSSASPPESKKASLARAKKWAVPDTGKGFAVGQSRRSVHALKATGLPGQTSTGTFSAPGTPQRGATAGEALLRSGSRMRDAEPTSPVSHQAADEIEDLPMARYEDDSDRHGCRRLCTGSSAVVHWSETTQFYAAQFCCFKTAWPPGGNRQRRAKAAEFASCESPSSRAGSPSKAARSRLWRSPSRSRSVGRSRSKRRSMMEAQLGASCKRGTPSRSPAGGRIGMGAGPRPMPTPFSADATPGSAGSTAQPGGSSPRSLIGKEVTDTRSGRSGVVVAEDINDPNMTFQIEFRDRRQPNPEWCPQQAVTVSARADAEAPTDTASEGATDSIADYPEWIQVGGQEPNSQPTSPPDTDRCQPAAGEASPSGPARSSSMASQVSAFSEADLGGMKKTKLTKIALDLGVDEDAVEEADEADNAKAALIRLIVAAQDSVASPAQPETVTDLG